MEESHHCARVKERGDVLTILAHIQELASPREILEVLLRRAVEGGGFTSGWILTPSDQGWGVLEGYPPIKSRKIPSLEKIEPFLQGEGPQVLKDENGSLLVVPVKSRGKMWAGLVLRSSENPDPQTVRDMEFLGVVAGGCIYRAEKEIRRLRALSRMVKAERLGRALSVLEDLEEIRARVPRDVKELTGCKGSLVLFKEEATLDLPELEEGELRPLVRQVTEEGKPYPWRDGWLFPVVFQKKALGLLILKGAGGEEWKGPLSLYLSCVAQALVKAQEKAILRERYRGVVASPLLCLFQLDSKGTISFVNTSMALTLGYPMREARDLVGKSFYDLVHPSSRGHVEERLEAQLKGEGRPEIHQITLKDKEGSPVPMMVSTVPISLPQGERGILGVAIDITEKERLLEDLSQRNKELESFAYSAAHELRGPIVYLKRVVAQPSLDDFPMEELKWAVNRLESTLKHLTSYSLMDNKEVKLERVSPYLLAEGIWRDIAKEVGVTMDIAINLPPVIKSDPFLLDLIFRNLLRNAFKYGIKGNPPLVEVGYARKKGEFLFYVRDHGEGFPPEKANEIFKPFVRLHASQKGTGLVLTIAKKAVEKLGGRIWAEGAPGKGATFYFTHPIL